MGLRIEPFAEVIPGYRLIERIGGGGFGEVWKVEAPGGFHKAVKIIYDPVNPDGSPTDAHYAEQELNAIKRVQAIRHPFLLSLERYDVIHGRLIIVSELADCNLWDRYQQYAQLGHAGIPRDELLRFIEEAAEVLDLMNIEHEVLHLDIKPQNLFLLHNHIKVGDFGLVKDLKSVVTVTGGVTPIYSAPETFDGQVSRSCDQYSLAIVYQELLTGTRPFVGTTIKQLLGQHTQSQPDLTALPECDRPAVARALSKKPADRYRTCLEFMQALRGGGMPGPTPRMTGRSGSRPRPSGEFRLASGPHGAETPRLSSGSSVLRTDTVPGSKAPPTGIDLDHLPREVPEEADGGGVLMPTLVLGLGRAGAEIVTRLRADLRDRFGPPSHLPSVKLLAVDTDPATIRATLDPHFPGSLTAEETITARLNKTGHYLQARRSGRSLIDGWLDAGLLHRIPRQHPITSGIRALGRLAYCDHVRTIGQTIAKNLTTCTDPESLARTERETGLEMRSNRPRVYILAHLAGGTGSGMFLDAAYTVRHRLHQLGYENPEVVGLLILPPLEENGNALANTYAALAELQYYSQAGTSFEAEYEDREARTVDPHPPFTRCYLLGTPTQDQLPFSADDLNPGDLTLQIAAEHLRRDLFTTFGRRHDEERERFGAWDDVPSDQPSPNDPKGPPFQTFGVHAYTWPRSQALAKAGQRLAQELLHKWLSVDSRHANSPGSSDIEAEIEVIWQDERFSAENILEQITLSTRSNDGEDPRTMLEAEARSLSGRGKRFGLFERRLDLDWLWQSLQRIQHQVGLPDSIGMKAQTGELEQIIAEAGLRIEHEFGDLLLQRLTDLIEQPNFRLAGTELVCRGLDKAYATAVDRDDATARELVQITNDSYFVVNCALSPDKGTSFSTSEVLDALKHFGMGRYESLLLRELCRICTRLRGRIESLLREIEFCRRQLGDVRSGLEARVRDTGTASEADLLPGGCSSLDEVAQMMIDSLGDDEIDVFDHNVQLAIEEEFTSLYRACVNSLGRQDDLTTLLYNRARAFLDHRLGNVDVVEMFFRRYGSPDQAVAMIQQAYHQATPVLTTGESRPEICILGLPPGEQGEPFQFLAQRALGYVDVTLVTHPDEILFYREVPDLSLAELPHVGPEGQEAYIQAMRTENFTPHIRTDIEDWIVSSV